MTRFLHVHFRDRVLATIRLPRRRAKDAAFTEEQLDDFADRLAGLLDADGAETRDEAAGHVFHGNQYTDVPTAPKPTSHTAKTIKAGLAQLLSSGHEFTIEELTKAVKASQPAQTAKYLKDLKKETPPGGLFIEQTANGYKLAAAPGTFVSPEPPKQEPPVEVAPPLATAQSKIPHYGMGYNVGASAPQLGKAEADKNYKGHLDSALSDLSEKAKDAKEFGTPEDAEKAIIAFKHDKAKAMAVWKASTTGEPIQEIKPQDGYFAADKQFAEDLAAGKDAAKAFEEWKQNTAMEKAGKFPPSAEPKPAAKTEPPAAPAGPKPGSMAEGHAAHFGTKKDYVPAGHKGVEESDFAPGANGSAPFAAEFNKLYNLLDAQSTGSIDGNKKLVQKGIEARLKDSKAFQSLQSAYTGTKYGTNSLVARLIGAWATSSGDHHPLSVAQQIAVREAFGMNFNEISTGNMSGLHSSTDHDEQVMHSAAQELGVPHNTPKEKESFRNGLHDFVRAQYDNTQAFFEKHGVKEICVARGMQTSAGKLPEKHALKLQPASSFSAQLSTAKQFAGTGALYMVKVPASQVLGSYLTGFGCTSEHEVVVLAHPDLMSVKMPSSGVHSISDVCSKVHTVASAKAPVAAGPKPSEAAIPEPKKKNFWTPFLKDWAAEGDLGTLKQKAAEFGNHPEYADEKEYADQLIAHLEKKSAPAPAAKPAPAVSAVSGSIPKESLPKADEDSVWNAKLQDWAAEKNVGKLKEKIAEWDNDGLWGNASAYAKKLVSHIESPASAAAPTAPVPTAKPTAAQHASQHGAPPPKPDGVHNKFSNHLQNVIAGGNLDLIKSAIEKAKIDLSGIGGAPKTKAWVAKLEKHYAKPVSTSAPEVAPSGASNASQASVNQHIKQHGASPAQPFGTNNEIANKLNAAITNAVQHGHGDLETIKSAVINAKNELAMKHVSGVAMPNTTAWVNSVEQHYDKPLAPQHKPTLHVPKGKVKFPHLPPAKGALSLTKPALAAAKQGDHEAFFKHYDAIKDKVAKGEKLSKTWEYMNELKSALNTALHDAQPA